MDNLQYLLREINLLREQYLIRDESQEKFNVFTTLLSSFDEVCLHSRFISSLLDPEGPHELKKLPLELFLESVHSDMTFSDNVEVIPNNENWSEYKEIDILIRDVSSKTAVIVENKINASDSNHEDRGQLEGYYQTLLADGFRPENIEVYYLTTDRHEPSAESLCTNSKTPELSDKVRCIDYSREITLWLTKLSKEVYNKPFLRETITQYINLIKDMTEDINIEERKALAALVGKNDDNLYSTKLLIENFKHICWHTIDDFTHELTAEFKRMGTEVLSSPDEDIITDIVHGGPIKRKVSFFYELRDMSGFTWTLGCDYDDLGGFYIGLEKEKNDAIPAEKKEQIKEYAKKMDLDTNDSWFFWTYLADKNGPLIYFWDFTYANTDTFNLISPEKRNQIVKTIAEFSVSQIQNIHTNN